MKKKIFSILATLTLVLGIGVVSAPGANAAASFHCTTYQDAENTSSWVKVCSVINGNYVQGYLELGPNSPARTMNSQYFSGGITIMAQFYNVPKGGSLYSISMQRPSGTNFQAAFGDSHGLYYAPTVYV